MNTEDIARVCHEVNRVYCISMGDHSQVPWAEAPAWQRQSAVNGVEFTLANPDSTPRESHENWMAVKETDGWKYGPVKDATKKEHPCFLPYDELPPVERAKDYIFRGVVRALARYCP